MQIILLFLKLNQIMMEFRGRTESDSDESFDSESNEEEI